MSTAEPTLPDSAGATAGAVTDSTDAIDELRAQWERERPDLEEQGLDAMALIGRIKRAAGLLERGLKPVFAEHGLESAEFDVLATLRRAGAPHELTPGGLLKSAMVTSGAITNRLDKLERKGYVERYPDPDDRRAVRVRLTDEGLAVVDRAMEDHTENEQRLLAALEGPERTALEAALRHLLVSLGDTRLG